MMNYIEEYVTINNLNHYVIHDKKNSSDVCLFVHGGPGQSNSCLFYYFGEFTNINMVYYDERGAGRTLLANKDQGSINIDQLVLDLKEMVEYVCKAYNVDKVFLLCHSFGTVIGSTYAQKYPNRIKGYIGCSEVIDMKKGEKMGFDLLKGKISAKKYQSLSAYPYGKLTYKLIRNVKKIEFKKDIFYNNKEINLFGIYKKSPIFKFKDIRAIMGGYKANKQMIVEMYDYNKEDILTYECPMYYILGEKDMITPTVLAMSYYEKISAPNKDIFLIPNAGHNPMIDNREEFFKAFDNIISGECLDELVTLYSFANERKESFSLSAHFMKNGQLRLEGHDFCKLADEMFGDEEYEYYYEFDLENLEKLKKFFNTNNLHQALVDYFKKEKKNDGFLKICSDNNIKYVFSSFHI